MTYHLLLLPAAASVAASAAAAEGTCCCKEDFVMTHIASPTITTPCNECDDGIVSMMESEDEKKDCLMEYGSEYCVNHGRTYFLYRAAIITYQQIIML